MRRSWWLPPRRVRRAACASPRSPAFPTQRDDTAHLHQLILHAALDVVEEREWDTPSMYLKVVDKFNDLLVSCYTTAGHTRLLLLHDSRLGEEGIRLFFQEAHELYLKVQLSPFHGPTTPIASARFDQLLRLAAKKHLQQ